MEKETKSQETVSLSNEQLDELLRMLDEENPFVAIDGDDDWEEEILPDNDIGAECDEIFKEAQIDYSCTDEQPEGTDEIIENYDEILSDFKTKLNEIMQTDYICSVESDEEKESEQLGDDEELTNPFLEIGCENMDDELSQIERYSTII